VPTIAPPFSGELLVYTRALLFRTLPRRELSEEDTKRFFSCSSFWVCTLMHCLLMESMIMIQNFMMKCMENSYKRLWIGRWQLLKETLLELLGHSIGFVLTQFVAWALVVSSFMSWWYLWKWWNRFCLPFNVCPDCLPNKKADCIGETETLK